MATFNKKHLERFWGRIQKTKTCWNWMAGLARGYGIFSIGYKTYLAHRISFELKNGDIKGKDLDHLCRNRKCVNPEHLEIVTKGENARRGLVAKLGVENVKSIRSYYKNNFFTQTELAQFFGVGQDEISRIINYKRWANV